MGGENVLYYKKKYGWLRTDRKQRFYSIGKNRIVKPKKEIFKAVNNMIIIVNK